MQRFDRDVAEDLDERETTMFIFHTLSELKEYDQTGVIKAVDGRVRAVLEAFGWFAMNQALSEEGRRYVTVHSREDIFEAGFKEVRFVEKPEEQTGPYEKSEDDIPEWRVYGDVALRVQGYFIISEEETANESVESGSGQRNVDRRWRKDLYGYRRTVYPFREESGGNYRQ